MAELIHTHSVHVTGPDGTAYRASTLGTQRTDGTWAGWLEFVPLEGGRPRRTDRETSQPDRRALEYWAGGLEPVYLEGALERATRRAD